MDAYGRDAVIFMYNHGDVIKSLKVTGESKLTTKSEVTIVDVQFET